MTARADVVVIGAGPAGCATAATLARAGRDVVVYDKATFPRDKCCGDGLTAAALRRLEALGVEQRRLESWHEVRDVSIRSPSGRTARLSLPDGPGLFAAVCRRADLDAELAHTAREAGATVLEGRRFAGIEHDGAARRLKVRIEGEGEIEADYVIGADGMWSPVRRAAGAAERDGSPYLGEWHAFRRYFEDVAHEAAEHLWIWFDEAILPGYAWSFPLAGGGANVGIMVRRRPGTTGTELHSQFEGVLATPFLRSLLGGHARPENGTRSWPIPTRACGSSLTALAGRVLFTGDAARVADPLTGEGVAQALESGVAAGEAIIHGNKDGPSQAARLYESAIGRSIRVDNELARQLCRLLGSSLGARTAVRGAGLPVVRRSFGAWLFEDFPRALPLTPWRWRRGALSQPGAYAREAIGSGAHRAPPSPAGDGG